MSGISYTRILVAVETNTGRWHGEHPARPHLLEKTGAEQMLTHLSTDLAGLFPEVKSCALCMAGALYDQTQLLRPRYPVFAALEALLAASYKGREFQSRLLSLGASSGQMPEADLQPSAHSPLGILLTLPLVIGGPEDRIGLLSEAVEHQFIEAGQLSAHSARGLEAQFGIAVNHARFMTVADLNAMLHLQLDHFGFLPLWQLLDHAVNEVGETLTVEARGGQRFHWNGEFVESRFETFDEWARGSGKSLPAADQLLAQAYADWTREYRQYLTTLLAHGITVHQQLAEGLERSADGSFLIETSSSTPARDAAAVTEHSAGELGTVAVTVISEGRQRNYYPLEPRGLNQLHAAIRESLGGTPSMSFPGCILYDPGQRSLQADSLRASG
jgi:hypothetical protein